MEYTGTYYEDVAESFVDDGYLVSVVNPAKIKAYSQVLLSRAKTDEIDAKIIAKFCASQKPDRWEPPSQKERKLRGLVRFSMSLKESRASYEVQLQTPNLLPEIGRSIKTLIDSLTDEIKAVEVEINELIDNDPDLRDRRRL